MVDPWQNYMAAAASGHAAYYSAGAAAAAAGRLNQVQPRIHLLIELAKITNAIRKSVVTNPKKFF